MLADWTARDVQALLTRWYIRGAYMDVTEVVCFMTVAKYTSRTVPFASLIAYNTTG